MSEPERTASETGRQALSSGLIDEIGGEEEAIAWLAAERKVDADLPVKDWEPRRSAGFFSYSDALVLWFAHKLGIAPDLLRAGGPDRLLPDRLKLDGLISVWQGPFGGQAAPAERAAQ